MTPKIGFSENVPKLRFPEFTGEWEQRKLGDMGETYAGLSGKTKEDFGHGDGKFITYMNVFSNPVSNMDMVENIEIDGKQNEVKAGDIFFTTSSETPEEVGMTSVMCADSPNTYLNSFCFGYRPTVANDKSYMAYMLRSENVRKKITFLAQGSTRYNISKNSVMDIAVPIPHLEEQKKIGSFFTEIDNTIALHQHKLDAMKEYKSGMLQKMFPKAGETVPEIRFPGFAGDWEQRKCGEVLQERNVQHPYSEDFPLVSFTVEKGVTPKTERYEREQLVTGDKTAKKYKETRLDDIVYNPANLKFGAIARNKYGNAVFSPIYVTYEVAKEMALPSYVERYVTRDTFIQNALQYQQGTVYERMAVNTDDFALLDINVPSIREQEEIGRFFDTLDNTIALHQRKLDAMKEYKSGLLQKMFC